MAVKKKKRKSKEVIHVEKVVNGKQVLGITSKSKLGKYVAECIKEYGGYVMEDRVIPDFRDGLKPVMRAILFSMHQQNNNSSRGFMKSAKTVGDVIAKYHPHGDSSTYQAMVGLAGVKFKQDPTRWRNRNTPVPLVEGSGNWGNVTDSAAAYRYSEARLSRFADLYMLDPDYMAVIDYVPNFDDSEKMPVILPSKLPVILLNGFEAIGVGAAAQCPSFALAGVLELTKRALNGEVLTAKEITKTLQFEYPYGGICVSDFATRKAVIKGKGSVAFHPSYQVDDKKRTITFTSVCPGLMSENSIQKWLERLAQLKSVSEVYDESDKSGIAFIVAAKRGIKDAAFKQFVKEVIKLSTRKESYSLGVSIRHPKGETAEFKRVSIADILTMWAKWRIGLEIKALDRLIALQEEKKRKQKLYLLAVDNLEIIIKALRVKERTTKVKIGKDMVEIDAAEAYLMKHMKITRDSAAEILELRVRQLRVMERANILAAIKEAETEIKALTDAKRKPAKRVIADLDLLGKKQL